MLRAYCLEPSKDWDEEFLFFLFAIREVVQESLGFSPAEPVFAHTVRVPLKFLKEKWLSEENEPENLLDYVSNFRFRLYRACKLARKNMSAVQSKMKNWFDKVLLLLPVPGSALQARYSGPTLL